MLVEGKSKSGGRNHHGRITMRHIGGGHKQTYRARGFPPPQVRRRGRRSSGSSTIRTGPHSSRSIKYTDGELAYILAPQRLNVGDKVVAGSAVDVKPGNAMPLASIPIGTIVHNVELKAGRGGQIARSAGAFVQLVGRDAGWAVLKLKSGETRRVRQECMATVGAVSNPDHGNVSTGKAGRTRWLGIRPTVRSVMMNPVDHPNGGRTKGGKHWATPWGKPTKGFKTRKNKATDKFIVRSRSRKSK